MTNTPEWTIGKHHIKLEGDELIFVDFNGPATLDDAKQLIELYRSVLGQHPRYLLADIGKSSMDAPTRKYLGKEVNPEWFKGAVYVGANALLRTVSNALNFLVLFNSKSNYETNFVATEADARVLIDSWRKKQA